LPRPADIEALKPVTEAVWGCSACWAVVGVKGFRLNPT
jgi:hypothetical protein